MSNVALIETLITELSIKYPAVKITIRLLKFGDVKVRAEGKQYSGKTKFLYELTDKLPDFTRGELWKQCVTGGAEYTTFTKK